MPDQDLIAKTNVTVDNTEALAVLGRLRGALAAKADIYKQAGRTVANRLRSHFRARNNNAKREPGWPRSNYWNAAAESVASEHDDKRARVTVLGNEVAPGASVAWHLTGGTIRPKTSKALAIPLQPEYKGKNPREVWPDKKGAFVWRNPESGHAFLATGEDGKLSLHYLLLKSITKDADPTVLPDDDVVESDITRVVSGFLRRAVRNEPQQQGEVPSV